jgi:hypothetical protein
MGKYTQQERNNGMMEGWNIGLNQEGWNDKTTKKKLE